MTDTGDLQKVLQERDSAKKNLRDINSKYLEKIEELSLIRRIGDALKDITDFSTVCKSIVSIIQQELDPDNCSLMVVDEEKGELVLRAAKGPYDNEAAFLDEGADATRFMIGRSVAGHVARHATSILVRDVLHDERYVQDAQTKVELRSLMSIPLVMGERVIAVLNLSRTSPDAFTPDMERILSIIANSSAAALENTRLYEKLRQSRDHLARENLDLKNELIEKYAPENIIGKSSSFTEILAKAEKVAGVDANVLITGESGTGKELVAKTLHYKSPRANGPFVAVNCAALPDTLLESELFGIEKGVATGVDRRTGKFEMAHGGTLFLDEIGDMELSTQAKILRVLQEREFHRVGGSKTTVLDTRVISATNRNLEEGIREGSFREDLYYRLKVVELALPALRDRRDDIPLLAYYFLQQACRRHALGEKWFSRDSLEMLRNAPWKGNVRELQNVVEQAAILSAGETIGPNDLSLAADDSSDDIAVYIPRSRTDYRKTLQEITRKADQKLIERALEMSGDNKSEAARLLGIGRRTLLYKLDKG